MIMASSWIYLGLGVIIALIALGAMAINTALEQKQSQLEAEQKEREERKAEQLAKEQKD